MYKILSILFWIIRQFFIPNPFEVLGEGITIIIKEQQLLLTPEILNGITGLILPVITFYIVGIYYSKGDDPSLGSLLYMIFFIIHIGLLYLISYIYPIIWLIILICVVYISLHVAIIILINKLKQ